jgi:hypothetical protein
VAAAKRQPYGSASFARFNTIAGMKKVGLYSSLGNQTSAAFKRQCFCGFKISIAPCP